MNKKVLLLIIILFFPFSVYAANGYYDEVVVTTSFGNGVDYESLDEIIVNIADTEETYEFPLTRSNNYMLRISSELFKLGNLSIRVGSLSDNLSFDYTVDYQDTKATIKLVVRALEKQTEEITEPTTVATNKKDNKKQMTILKYVYIAIGIVVLIFIIIGVVKIIKVGL